MKNNIETKSLKNFKLFAQGCQAEIYLYEENKVLRVLRNPLDNELLLNEVVIMKSLSDTVVNVPEVFEFLTIEGRPAVVVERIYGDSMLTDLRKHPLSIFNKAEELASLHLSLAQNGSINNLKSVKARACFLTGNTDLLKPNMKAFIYDLIDELPEGSELCHGDFHPGNILQMDGKNYVIDWFGAYKGDLLSDVAHTYLILKNVPRFPGINPVQHAMMKFSGGLLASAYLKAFMKQRDIDWQRFSKWMVIKAAERISYGISAEKQRLITFVETCERFKHDPALWLRNI
ncbi:MAG: phosphotransferase [Clostridia bacterium]|nr:phosphotransferase [Clostridia bacterium]